MSCGAVRSSGRCEPSPYCGSPSLPCAWLWAWPAAVRRVTLESNGRQVELAHADGSWSAGAGASVVTVALMSDVEGRLLPLQAYRSLPADTASPEFGLVDPEITLR